MTSGSVHIRQQLQRGDFALDVDLQLPGLGVTALFGRSGSGKTSLLRCIAGLEPAARGELSVKGDRWQTTDHFQPAHRRRVGYVVQDAGLFPHLSVQGNLDFAIKRAGYGQMPEAEVVQMLAIQPLLERMPGALSGGERQRVAIARALLSGPDLLLMDEPMASLDRRSKAEIMPFLERLHRELSIPLIYVSHSADEVARLADHLIVMDDGKCVGEGPLGEMLARLDFPLRLEDEAGVVWQGSVAQRDPCWKLDRLETPGGELWIASQGSGHGEVRVRILARDVSLALRHHEDSSILNILPGQVEELREEDDAPSVLVRVQVRQALLLARITRKSAERLMLRPGSKVWAQIKSVALLP